jgi:hypothetical protein
LVLELARCEYVARRENVIAVGNSGTGKTKLVADKADSRTYGARHPVLFRVEVKKLFIQYLKRQIP